MVFVYPNVLFLLITGYARMRYQGWLINSGRRPTPVVDYAALVCELMLEAPALAFLYRGMQKQENASFVVASGSFVAFMADGSSR